MGAESECVCVARPSGVLLAAMRRSSIEGFHPTMSCTRKDTRTPSVRGSDGGGGGRECEGRECERRRGKKEGMGKGSASIVKCRCERYCVSVCAREGKVL